MHYVCRNIKSRYFWPFLESLVDMNYNQKGYFYGVKVYGKYGYKII